MKMAINDTIFLGTRSCLEKTSAEYFAGEENNAITECTYRGGIARNGRELFLESSTITLKDVSVIEIDNENCVFTGGSLPVFVSIVFGTAYITAGSANIGIPEVTMEDIKALLLT